MRRIAEENRNATRDDSLIGLVLKNIYSRNKPLKEKPILQADRELAISYQKKAKSYKNQKEYIAALDYLQKAMSIEEKIYREIYPYEAKKSKGYLPYKIDNSPILGDIYHEIGFIYNVLNKYTEALEYYNRALDIKNLLSYYGNFLVKNESGADLYNELSLIYYKTKDYRRAYYTQKKASKLYLKLRHKIFKNLTYNEKIHFLYKNNYNMHNLLNISFAYQLNYHSYKPLSQLHRDAKVLPKYKDEEILRERKEIVDETCKFWLISKGEIGNIEIYLMNLRHKKGNQEVNQKTIEFLDKTRQYANLLLKQLANPKAISKKERSEIKRLEKERTELERFISPHLNRLNATGKHGADFLTPYWISEKLYKNELYIDFARTDKHYYLFTINKKQQVTSDVLDESVEEIDRLVNSFRDKIIAKEDTKHLGKKLYKLIFSKVKDINKYKKVIISPDGLLNLLPFEALRTENNRYMIEEQNIAYVLSGRDLYKSRENERYFIGKSYNREIACFSYIDYSDTRERVQTIDNGGTKGGKNIDSLFHNFKGLKPLLESKNEAEFIKKTFPENKFTSYSDKNATKDALYSLNSPQILHLSTHSFYGKEDKLNTNPLMKAGLALSEFNAVVKYDNVKGLMSALEFSTLNLHDTELVMFSSCNSGVGDIHSSEGVSGLNRGARIAGADRVISTLWSVDENASLELTEKFYTHLAKNSLKSRLYIPRRDKFKYSEALRATKLSMIEKHPFYWAGFIQYGVNPKLEWLNKYEY